MNCYSIVSGLWLTNITVPLHKTSASQTATINKVSQCDIDTLVIAATALALLAKCFFSYCFVFTLVF